MNPACSCSQHILLFFSSGYKASSQITVKLFQCKKNIKTKHEQTFVSWKSIVWNCIDNGMTLYLFQHWYFFPFLSYPCGIYTSQKKKIPYAIIKRWDFMCMLVVRVVLMWHVCVPKKPPLKTPSEGNIFAAAALGEGGRRKEGGGGAAWCSTSAGEKAKRSITQVRSCLK